MIWQAKVGGADFAADPKMKMNVSFAMSIEQALPPARRELTQEPATVPDFLACVCVLWLSSQTEQAALDFQR